MSSAVLGEEACERSGGRRSGTGVKRGKRIKMDNMGVYVITTGKQFLAALSRLKCPPVKDYMSCVVIAD